MIKYAEKTDLEAQERFQTVKEADFNDKTEKATDETPKIKAIVLS